MPNRNFVILSRNLSTQNLFWIFTIVHLLLWVVLPTLVSPNPPLDVIEGYVWGHEWPIGTYKHPPMQAWWLEGLADLTDRAHWSHFLASQLAIVVAFWAVWKTGLQIMSERAALIGVFLLEGVIYFNFTSPEFNPNVMQLPFWALICLYYYRSIKEDRWQDWVLLGLSSAGGLYSKYSTFLLLLSLFVLTLARPESRRKLSRPGPYISLAIAGLLFLPHFNWLYTNDFLPFNYAHDRLKRPIDKSIIHSFIMAPLLFALSQLLAILPALLIFVSLIGHKKPLSETPTTKFDRTFINTITFGPFILVLIMASFFGLQIHDMWATPFWNFIGVWILFYSRPVLAGYALHRFAYSWIGVTLLILLVYVTQTIYYPYLTHKTLRIQFPGQQLSTMVNAAWQERYHKPLTYVIGDTWPAGNIAYFEPNRAHVLIDGNFEWSPWINALDLKHQGAVMVWCIRACNSSNNKDGSPQYIENFPLAEIQPPLIIKKNTKVDVPPVEIGWAILPPQND